MRVRGNTGVPGGEQSPLDRSFSLAYEELRRIAAKVRSTDPKATLNPTALVNEAWIKLNNSPPGHWTSQLHFKRIAARAMRQLLVDSARRRKAHKRSAALVAFDNGIAELIADTAATTEDEFLKLDAALDTLATLNERQAVIVENRFFAGLGVEETAEILGISKATVQRDWRSARAWLGRELRNQP